MAQRCGPVVSDHPITFQICIVIYSRGGANGGCCRTRGDARGTLRGHSLSTPKAPAGCTKSSEWDYHASHDWVLNAPPSAHSGPCVSANPERYWLRSPSNARAMVAAEPVSIDSSDMPPVQPV